MTSDIFRSGRVAIVGRPNVGKSTLLNLFLGEKIAIVSPKPETTRQNLLGILTLPQAQILFVDTPGLSSASKNLLSKFQIQAARGAFLDADALLFMTEAQIGLTDADRKVIGMLPKKGNTPVFLAINKADRVRKELILPQIEEASRRYPFRGIFPISAQKKQNTDRLLLALIEALPEGTALYPTDQVTDRSLRDLAKELIREKVLLFTHDEIPHGIAVTIEEWRPGQGGRGSATGTSPPAPTYVRAVVYVERDSQKGILIGKQGHLMKRVGEAARREIELLVGASVYLDLWVKVAHNWRKDPIMLRRLGYAG